MSQGRIRALVGAIGAIVALMQAPASATHSWGNYHWARTSNPFTLALGDNVSSVWDSSLSVASADWSASSVLNTTIVAGRAKPRNCRPTAGRVEVCNATYGSNGWLGIAQIWASGDHITQGVVKMNDTYFNTSTYNDPDWRQFVVCQEVGHTFGLNHQDEDFGDTNLGTCMDYTSDPGGHLNGNASNLTPNQHDFDQLAANYSHLDSTSTVGQSTSLPASAAAAAEHNFGRLIQSQGRTAVFELDLGNNQKVITFVIWA